MTWEKAPREPKPAESVAPWLVVVSICLGLVGGRPWWAWVLLAAAVVTAVGRSVQYYRDSRTYRAWVAWDEAGGPDADHRRRGAD